MGNAPRVMTIALVLTSNLIGCGRSSRASGSELGAGGDEPADGRTTDLDIDVEFEYPTVEPLLVVFE